MNYRHDPADPASLADDQVFSIYEDQAGNFWVGTWNGGLDRFDRESELFTHSQHDPDDPNSLSHNSVVAIFQDDAGNLWAGTWGGGLNRLIPETRQFVRYQYDPSDPEPRLESTDDSQPRWRRETVSLRTAYGEERFQVHVHLPRDAPPPYQAVIYFPGSGAFYETNSLTTSLAASRFVPESGRALIRPVYDGLYERRRDPDAPRGPNAFREMVVHWSQDISRTLDYLETRDDIDADRIAFYGLSLGGEDGPIFTAIDDRFRASVLFSGHLHAHQMSDPPETIPLHFAPRSTVPVILINGNNDFIAPVKTSLEPMLAFQGAPPEHKKLVLLEGGHIPPLNDVIREALDWLDRYLGPVEGR